MNFIDLDPFYAKSIAALYSKEHFRTNEASLLQKIVEDSIKAKSGKEKDLTAIVNSCMKQSFEEYKNLSGNIEESKTASSSEHELELDLLKEDLMCVVCNGMGIGVRNQLLECSDCHSLYHQECHRPVVSQQDATNTWVCQNCKDVKKLQKSPSRPRASTPPYSSKSVKATSSSSSSSSSSHHSTSLSGSSSSYKSSKSPMSTTVLKLSSSSGKLPSRPSPTSTPNSSSASSSSSSSSRNLVTPTINIISADKRIQSMKKKAAKLQEKRKLPR